MIGTDAWRQEWRATQTGGRVALLAITLPTGVTMRVATAKLKAPDGNWYEPGIVGDNTVSERIQFLAGRSDPARCQFQLLDVRYSWMSAGTRLSNHLATDGFKGATVTLWLGAPALTNWSDWLQRFEGEISSWTERGGLVEFTAVREWPMVTVTPRTVGRAEYTGALDDVVGAPIPLDIGDNRGPAMREPYVNPYGDEYRVRELIAGGNRAHKALLVDVGRGGGGSNPPAKVLVAGHAISQLLTNGPSPNFYGTSGFVQSQDGVLHVMDIDIANLLNTATEGGWQIPDNTALAWASVFPSDIVLVSNYAVNPRAILDRKNEVTFASLNHGALQRNLNAKLPTMVAPGKPYEARAYILYRSSAAMAGYLFQAANVTTGVTPASLVLGASTTPTFRNINLTAVPGVFSWDGNSVGSGLPNTPWDFSQVELRVNSGGTSPTGTVDVFMIGIAVRYIPAQDITEYDRVVKTGKKRGKHGGILGVLGAVGGLFSTHRNDPRERLEHVVQSAELHGKFFANSLGAANTGAVDFTGSFGSVISLPPDVANFVLQRFGLVSQLDVQTGVGQHGSFVDARALLKTWNQKPMTLGSRITEETAVEDVVEQVAEAACSAVVQRGADGQWQFHPWRRGAAPNYTLPLSRLDLVGADKALELATQPASAILTGLSLAYGVDESGGNDFAHEVSASIDRSSAGQYYRNLRDSLLKVTASANDRFDWLQNGGSNVAFNLTPGSYDLLTLLAMLRADTFGATSGHSIGFGGVVAAAVNDRFPFKLNGVAKLATLTPGIMTMEDRAADAQAAIAATGAAGITVTFNRATLKYTVTPAGGTTLILDFFNNPQKNAAAIFGFIQATYNGGVGVAYTSDARVEDRRFALSFSDQFTLKFLSGVNGLLGTKRSCWEILGFDWNEDVIGIGVTPTAAGCHALGLCPKFEYEKLLTTRSAKVTIKRPVPTQSRWIADTFTAIESRNRSIDLGSIDRGMARFKSGVHADAELFDRIDPAADLDAIRGYGVDGTDGSWVGKTITVLETHQHFGTSFDTEGVGVDLSS